MTTAEDQANQDLMRQMNDLVNRVLGGNTRSARWRYYGPRGALGQQTPASVYFWTTERMPDGKFVSGVYHYRKTNRSWTAERKVKHTTRKAAAARAQKLWHANQT